MKFFIKPLFSVAILSSLLLIASCGDDPDPVSKIVGKWDVLSSEPVITVAGGGTLVAYLMTLGMPQQEAEEFANELTSGEAIEIDGTIEFKANGTYEALDGTDASAGKWELNSDGKTLVLDKNTSSELAVEVTTLNDTELVLDLDLTEDVGFPANTIEYHGVITFKRL